MNKKKIFGIVFVCALIVTLGCTTVSGYMTANRYKMQLNQNYQRALNDLNGSVDNIGTTLDKAAYANTATQQNGLAAKLMRESSMAKAAISTLPITDTSMDKVSKFITQVGDFAMTLSNKVSAHQKITDEEYGTMLNLEKYAKTLQSDLMNINTNVEPTELTGSLEKTANDFTDFPTLIYDGPFSDHVMQRKPKMTQGKSELLQGNAQNTAAEFLGLKQEQLKHTQDTAGNMPTYNFTTNDGAVTISVTKNGGYISEMQNSRDITSEKLTYEDASKIAQAFLKSRGITDMRESYYVITDGRCVINYAYRLDNIVCYPDLIKVKVALDNGEIVGFDSVGYLMNHTTRKLTPKLTADEAQKNVSPRLKVESRELALIPTPGLHEVLCYEFRCKGSNGDRVLVYINANTGYEEQILILQISDNGVLTQ
ncbi:MAG: germination protein YpeB [Ruminococcaceae bacterium]|nr:germination protein YpeB [Oscillospiraceae bacterium]